MTTSAGHTAAPTRQERDSLGALELPANVYWGINTARALENFAISGRPIAEFPDLIVAFAEVKQAAARANADLDVIARPNANAIVAACQEIIDGRLHDQFVVDLLQGGAGTSTNMNVNEVIANRALEMVGHRPGDYVHISPNDDVNAGQSTNDTYPTAMKLALLHGVERLLGEMRALEDSLSAKAAEFADIVKVGRTQLQDAVPMTLGQEFTAFVTQLRGAREALAAATPALREISLGATAVGTGIAADPDYAKAVLAHLRQITGLDLTTTDDLVGATTDTGPYVQLSGQLKRYAVQISKLASDLRLLSSGPQAGLGDINLPPRQAGSSIMPGKVNPVIPEVVNAVAFTVIGTDATVTAAAEAGQLQLNAFLPVILVALLSAEQWLTAALITFRRNAIEGITANRDALADRSSSFAGLMTAFIPYIGYQQAGVLAAKALATGRPIAELLTESNLIAPADVATLLDPRRLAGEDTSIPNLTRDYTADRSHRE